MEVFVCPVGYEPERKEHDCVVEYFEGQVREQVDCVIYCNHKPSKSDGRQYCLGLFGHYGIPHMSDPASDFGLYAVNIDPKLLIFDENSPAMHHTSKRGLLAYELELFRPYVKAEFAALRAAFLDAGYQERLFVPRQDGDRITNYRSF